jgi:hypothetical protein
VTVLEPGGMRTEWSMGSMKVPPISEPYKQTVGVWAEMLRGTTHLPSDPSKVGDIVLKVSEVEDPPLRLLIGPDAIEYAKHAAQAIATSDEKWRDLSVSSAV